MESPVSTPHIKYARRLCHEVLTRWAHSERHRTTPEMQRKPPPLPTGSAGLRTLSPSVAVTLLSISVAEHAGAHMGGTLRGSGIHTAHPGLCLLVVLHRGARQVHPPCLPNTHGTAVVLRGGLLLVVFRLVPREAHTKLHSQGGYTPADWCLQSPSQPTREQRPESPAARRLRLPPAALH